MNIHYKTLLQEVLALWPEQIEWHKSEDPLAARYVEAFVSVLEAMEAMVAQEGDEILREMKGNMNWAIATGFHWVIVDEQIEQQGKVSGVLYKSDLPLDRVKQKFISDVIEENPEEYGSWAPYLREHNILITGLDDPIELSELISFS